MPELFTLLMYKKILRGLECIFHQHRCGFFQDNEPGCTRRTLLGGGKGGTMGFGRGTWKGKGAVFGVVEIR
jgi:hypothetical protein